MVQSGGALYFRGSPLTISGATASDRVVIRNCYAAQSGGGIYASYDEDSNGQSFSSPVSLGSYVDIVNNTAAGDPNAGDGSTFGCGGGIFQQGDNITGREARAMDAYKGRTRDPVTCSPRLIWFFMQTHRWLGHLYFSKLGH